MKHLFGALLIAAACITFAGEAGAGTTINRSKITGPARADSLSRDSHSLTQPGMQGATRMRCISDCKRSFNSARNGCLHGAGSRDAMSGCLSQAKLAGNSCMRSC